MEAPMNTTLKTNRFRKFLPIALIVAAAALMVAPASGVAFKFGSKLTTDTQPSNAGTGQPCDIGPGVCTWGMNEAYGRPNGGESSPFSGTLRKVRLIANAPGSFKLQILKVRDKGNNAFDGKVVANGPKITYQGQADPNALTYTIETFTLKNPIRIRKGQRLGIRTASTSLIRCSSGGPNTLQWQPPLALGGGFGASNGYSGCWLLLEGIGKKG